MSRQIDPENLSNDDKVYILHRPSLRREFILQGYGDPLEGFDPKAPEEPEEDDLSESVSGSVEGSTQQPSDTVEEEDDEEDDPAKQWNTDMTNAELQAVIDARNADYEDDEKITPEGKNKADLIAALETDDRELAGDDEN